MDKNRKRELKQAVRQAERQLKLESLPAELDRLSMLFDFLDDKLTSISCRHDHSLTRQWCRNHEIDETRVIAWTQANGGFCDCEVLANVEETLEEASKAK